MEWNSPLIRGGYLFCMKKRRSLRLPYYDYSSAGYYFVTVCTKHRKKIFGDVVREGDDVNVELSPIGKIVERELLVSEIIRDEIGADVYVIMPNHIHIIVWVNPECGAGDDDRRQCTGDRRQCTGDRRQCTGDRRSPLRQNGCRGRRCRPDARRRCTASGRKLQKRSLGSFMAGFKSAVTSSTRFVFGNPEINIWQRNYYERIIRNRRELHTLRKYIEHNPVNWWLDEYYE